MFNVFKKIKNKKIHNNFRNEDHFERFKSIFEVMLDENNFVNQDLRYISLMAKNKFSGVFEFNENSILVKFTSPELKSILLDNSIISTTEKEKIFKYIKDSKIKPGVDIYTNITIHEGNKFLVLNYVEKSNDFEFIYITISEYNTHIKQLVNRDINIINQIVGMKDNETLNHTIRVGELSSYLANLLGKDKEYCEKIKIAAQLHDIGKIRIPDSILLKDSPLTNDEYEMMKLHTIYGAEIVDKLSFIFIGIDAMELIKNIVSYHHEKYDGSGYNDGLSGENIPLEARIVSIIDSFDSIKTDNNELTYDEIKKVMEKLSGIDFDPKLLDVFLEHYYEFVGIRGLYDDNSIDKK